MPKQWSVMRNGYIKGSADSKGSAQDLAIRLGCAEPWGFNMILYDHECWIEETTEEAEAQP